MTFQSRHIQLKDRQALYFMDDSRGEVAHFYPGNGLPVGVYQPLLDILAEKYQLTSLAYRAQWPDAKAQKGQVRWSLYADDLIDFLEAHYSEPIIGMGHSQGGYATIVAAAKRPDLFKELILIDPASVSKFNELLLGLIPYPIKKWFDPYKSALKKKAIWESPAAYLATLQSNRAYKRIPPENLEIFAENSLEPENGHYKLAFPIDWEVSNFALPTNLDRYIKQLKVPYRFILGKPSVFSSDKVRSSWKKVVTGPITVNSQYGHLIPLEAPEYCAAQILEDSAG